MPHFLRGAAKTITICALFTPALANALGTYEAPVLAEGAVVEIPESNVDRVAETGFTKLLKFVWNKSKAVRLLWNSYQAYDLVGWEAGRLMAIREGLPDPGPKPNQFMLQKVIYAVANKWGYKLFD